MYGTAVCAVIAVAMTLAFKVADDLLLDVNNNSFLAVVGYKRAYASREPEPFC